MRITEKEYSLGYEKAKLVFDKKETMSNAVDFLSDKEGLNMKKSSARYYLDAYLCMRNGIIYQNTINESATKYYLEHIYSENGEDALKLALESLNAHVSRYSEYGKGKLQSLNNLYEEFKNKIPKGK